jgi:hypothetical protein
VIVAQHWSSSLILVLALGLPLRAGHFPTKLHRYFNAPITKGVTEWQSTRDFVSPYQDRSVVYLLSGDTAFLRQILTLLRDCQQLIVMIEIPQRSVSCSAIQCVVADDQRMLREFNLRSLAVADLAVGGATNGHHTFRFGSDIGDMALLAPKPGLPRILHHFLDGGIDGRFPSIPTSSLPVLSNPARAVLLHNGIVRPRGLFPCCFPDILVYSLSYRLRDCWVVCALTLAERFCLHQLPLSMDPLLASLNSGGSLPFEDSPSLGVYTSFFGKLWGTSGGDLHDRPNGNHDAVLDNALLNHGKEVVEDVETREEDGTRIEVTDVEVVEDGKTIEDVEVVGAVEHDETAPDLCRTLRTEDDCLIALTIASGPDMSSNAARGKGAGSETAWKLDIDFLTGREDNTRLTDADTITSCASEETICRFPRARDENGTALEEHELGPSPTKNPGPPFKVGDLILCNIPGNFGGMDPKVSWLQRGFVMEADHPRYKI